MSAIQQDQLLKSLQDEVLKDSDQNLPALVEAIAGISRDHKASVREILRICHTLKGNLQAVGFLHCANYVHSMETQLQKVEEELAGRRDLLPEQEFRYFEFVLSDCLQGLESYYNALKAAPEDKEDLLQARQMPLRLLEDWRPSPEAPATAVATATVAATAPVPAPVSEPDPFAHKPDATVDEIFPPFDLPPPAVTAAITAALAAVAAPTNVIALPRSTPFEKTSPETESRIAGGTFLICRKGGRYFGVPVEYVTEILASLPINPLPVPSAQVLGMISVRGEPIPVLDMSRIWQNEDNSDPGASNRYIIVGQLQSTSFGFEVDEVCELRQLDSATFQKNETLGQSSSIPPVIETIALQDDRAILLLEISKVVSL